MRSAPILRPALLPVLALTLLLGGCAAGGALGFETPTVRLAGVSLERAGLTEQRWRVDVVLENPNPVPVPVDALDYTVSIAGVLLGSGRVTPERRIGPGSSTPLVLDFTTRTDRVMTLLQEWLTSPPDVVDYQLEGELDFGLLDQRVPIARSGTVELRIRR